MLCVSDTEIDAHLPRYHTALSMGTNRGKRIRVGEKAREQMAKERNNYMYELEISYLRYIWLYYVVAELL